MRVIYRYDGYICCTEVKDVGYVDETRTLKFYELSGTEYYIEGLSPETAKSILYEFFEKGKADLTAYVVE